VTRSAPARCADRSSPALSSAAPASSSMGEKFWKTCGTPGVMSRGDLDVGPGGLLREADGVVEENLVTSGLDDQGAAGRTDRRISGL